MGIGAAIASIGTWLTSSAGAAAIGGAALGAGAASVLGKKSAPPTPKGLDNQVVGGATPATTTKEEDVVIGSGREDAKKGRSKGRRSLMAPQTGSGPSGPSDSQKGTPSQGIRV